MPSCWGRAPHPQAYLPHQTRQQARTMMSEGRALSASISGSTFCAQSRPMLDRTWQMRLPSGSGTHQGPTCEFGQCACSVALRSLYCAVCGTYKGQGLTISCTARHFAARFASVIC